MARDASGWIEELPVNAAPLAPGGSDVLHTDVRRRKPPNGLGQPRDRS